jgi:hypothetical protein
MGINRCFRAGSLSIVVSDSRTVIAPKILIWALEISSFRIVEASMNSYKTVDIVHEDDLLWIALNF